MKGAISRIGRLLNRYSFSISQSVVLGPASVSRSRAALHMPLATISRSKWTTLSLGISRRSAGSRRVMVSISIETVYFMEMHASGSTGITDPATSIGKWPAG